VSHDPSCERISDEILSTYVGWVLARDSALNLARTPELVLDLRDARAALRERDQHVEALREALRLAQPFVQCDDMIHGGAACASGDFDRRCVGCHAAVVVARALGSK